MDVQILNIAIALMDKAQEESNDEVKDQLEQMVKKHIDAED